MQWIHMGSRIHYLPFSNFLKNNTYTDIFKEKSGCVALLQLQPSLRDKHWKAIMKVMAICVLHSCTTDWCFQKLQYNFYENSMTGETEKKKKKVDFEPPLYFKPMINTYSNNIPSAIK